VAVAFLQRPSLPRAARRMSPMPGDAGRHCCAFFCLLSVINVDEYVNKSER